MPIRELLSRSRFAGGAVLVLAAIALIGRSALWSAVRPAPPAPALPTVTRDDGFVSSDTCRGCHPSEYASWSRTYHKTMTQVVTPATVLGNFDGVTLSDRGRTLQLERRGDEFWIEMVDPDWDYDRAANATADGEREDAGGSPPRSWNRVVMSTGSHYQQTYWVPLAKSGGLFQMGWSWVREDQKWIPRSDLFLTPPTEGRMPTSWNLLCVRCHASGGRIAEPFLPGQISSKVGELGIACEACHDAAAEHVRLNRNPLRRYGLHSGEEGDPSTINPGRLPHDRSSMVCGRCHSVSELLSPKDWWNEGDTFRPGDDLRQSREMMAHQPGTSDYEGAFWGDGTYKAGGREFTGMELSRCYTEGELSCLSCHSMHSAPPDKQVSPGMDGDEACLSCHKSFRTTIAEHTHHAPTSNGSRCQNCHMPYTSYALFKGIRSHRIDSPRMDTSALFGRPNACNLCHLDRTLGWTADRLNEWYGQAPIRLAEDERNVAASLLWMLKGDASQRVLAAWSLSWPPAREASGSDWAVPALAQLLEDPYPAVRRVSHRTLRKLAVLPGENEISYDPLDPPAERGAAHQKLLAAWREQPRSAGPRSAGAHEAGARPELLQGPGGTLMEAEFQRLFGARNDQPITINE